MGGEGDVIAANRGFRTQSESVAYPSFFRVARSSYFKSFLLPGEDTISFECDYILCTDLDQCDGLSCSDSVSSGSARRRRSVPDVPDAQNLTRINQYPSVKTGPVKMIRKPELKTVVEAGMLVRGDEDVAVYRKSTLPALLASQLDETKIYLLAGVSLLVLLLLLLGICYCVRSCLTGPPLAVPYTAYGGYTHSLQSPCINDSYYCTC